MRKFLTPIVLSALFLGGNGAAFAGGELRAYIGKYPFDEVQGTTFLEHPLVVDFVNKIVPDPAARQWILKDGGPHGPIEVQGDKLKFFGCEAHNCGFHKWTVAISPDGRDGEICYRNNDKLKKAYRYYPDGRMHLADEPCE